MKIETAPEVMRLAHENPSVLGLHLHFQKFYMANRDKLPTDEQYSAATQYLSNLTAIKFTQDQIEEILALYPQSRILLAVMGSDENAVHEALQFAVAHFLLSCRWPEAGEQLDLHDFTGLLRLRAVEMGFKTLQGLNEFSPMDEVDESFNVEPRGDEKLDLQASELTLTFPAKKPSIRAGLDNLVGKVGGAFTSKLAGKFAAKLGSKPSDKPSDTRQDPTV